MTEWNRKKGGQSDAGLRTRSLASWLGARNVNGVPVFAPRDVVVFLEIRAWRS